MFTKNIKMSARSTVKKSLKSIAFVFSCLVLLLGCVGCGPSAKSKAPLEIAWWGTAYNKQYINKLIRIYQKKYPGTEVRAIDLDPQRYNSQLLTRAASDDLPDIILARRSTLNQFCRKGVYIPLDKYVNDPSFVKDKSDFTDASFKGSFFEGKCYALPIWDNVFTLFYNNEILQKAGITVNASTQLKWTDFLKIAKRVTVKEKFQYGFSGFRNFFSQWEMYMLIKQFGGTFFSKDYRSINLNHPNTIEALEYARDMYTLHKVSPTVADLNSMGDNTENFQTGKIVFQSTGRWSYDTLVGNSRMDFGVIKMPYERQKYMGNSAVYLGISKNSKQPDEAFKFIKYLASVDGQKYVYKMRTDIPIRKSLLFTKDFLNSKGQPEADKIFQKEIVKAEPFVGEVLEGYLEWEKKVINPLFENYFGGNITTEEFIKEAEKTYKEIVGVNI